MKKKVVLIGWDAADWQIINPLLKEGKLPALQKLMNRGVSGNLSTMNPPFSPMLWTSVATGKTPDKHGVLGFLELDVEKQQIRPVTVSERKVRALWNIFHSKGLRSNLIGWWPSHPAEPINGKVVSDQFAKSTGAIDVKWPVSRGSVFPPELAVEIMDLRVHPEEITEAHILPFMPLANKIDQEKSLSLKMFSKILAENATIHASSTYLIENTEWDFTAVYYDMIDHLCHGFMKFHPPKLPNISKEDFEIHKEVINSAYRFQDMMLERTLDLVGEDALVIVMSDHGYVSDQTRLLQMPKNVHAAPSLEHREFGMFVAAGPGIKKGETLFGCSLLDIAPTILDYMDLPVARDMDGTVLKDAFITPKTTTYIDSYENLKGDFGEHKETQKGDALSEHAAMQQLIELGYVDSPNGGLKKALHQTACDLKFSLARVLLGRGERIKAKELLEELILEEVEIESYLVDLMHLNLSQKNYKESRKYLEQLRLIDLKNVQKTKLTEAKILLGEGKVKAGKIMLMELTKHHNLSAQANFELAKMLMKFSQFETALTHINIALQSRPNDAKCYHNKSICLLRLSKLEDALDSGLKAVELVRNFPDAHYIIGQILEKLGDMENAKQAYALANFLRPNLNKPKIAIENINKALSVDKEKDTDTSTFPEIIIVSGLPRSGTSMMMQMLDAGGLNILSDHKRKEDESNPKGYFEYEKVKRLHVENDWLNEAEGHCLKVIAQQLKFLPSNFRYKVIFMIRAMEEVVVSQEIMLKKHGVQAKKNVEKAYNKAIEGVDVWHAYQPGVELLKVAYSEVIDSPEKEIEKIAHFLNQDVDQSAMKAAVDSDLYRNRVIKF